MSKVGRAHIAGYQVVGIHHKRLWRLLNWDSTIELLEYPPNKARGSKKEIRIKKTKLRDQKKTNKDQKNKKGSCR